MPARRMNARASAVPSTRCNGRCSTLEWFQVRAHQREVADPSTSADGALSDQRTAFPKADSRAGSRTIRLYVQRRVSNGSMRCVGSNAAGPSPTARPASSSTSPGQREEVLSVPLPELPAPTLCPESRHRVQAESGLLLLSHLCVGVLRGHHLDRTHGTRAVAVLDLDQRIGQQHSFGEDTQANANGLLASRALSSSRTFTLADRLACSRQQSSQLTFQTDPPNPAAAVSHILGGLHHRLKDVVVVLELAHVGKTDPVTLWIGVLLAVRAAARPSGAPRRTVDECALLAEGTSASGCKMSAMRLAVQLRELIPLRRPGLDHACAESRHTLGLSKRHCCSLPCRGLRRRQAGAGPPGCTSPERFGRRVNAYAARRRASAKHRTGVRTNRRPTATQQLGICAAVTGTIEPAASVTRHRRPPKAASDRSFLCPFSCPLCRCCCRHSPVRALP